MPKCDRRRVDYVPGPAAVQALEVAGELLPELKTQALIDWLVVVGASALRHRHWAPPLRYGRNRLQWLLPADLRPGNGAKITDE